jgi:hypothetical protein
MKNISYNVHVCGIREISTANNKKRTIQTDSDICIDRALINKLIHETTGSRLSEHQKDQAMPSLHD